MNFLNKSLLSFGALFIGPILVILTNPFFSWGVTAGLFTMAITSGMAIYDIWRKPKKDEPPSPLWRFVRRCWRGEERLWRVFWIIGVGASAVFQGLSYAGTKFNAPMIWWIVVVLVLAVPVEVWWTVSVWRCAANTNKKIWSVLSRTFAIIQGAYSAYNLFMLMAYPIGI